MCTDASVMGPEEQKVKEYLWKTEWTLLWTECQPSFSNASEEKAWLYSRKLPLHKLIV